MSRDDGLRTLRVSKPVRSALVELRVLEHTTGPTTLDAGVLDGVERSLDARLPDDVLAAIASGCEALRDVGLALDRIVRHTEAARAAKLPAELIAIGRGEGGLYFAISRRAADVSIHEFDGETGEVTAQRPFADWLQAMVELRREELVAPDVDDPDDRELAELEIGDVDLDAFRPRLVAPPPSTGKQVRHTTFGVGEVIREIGAGDGRKVEVRFPTGTKVLIARVLEEI